MMDIIEIKKLIPFYIAGTLDAEEYQEVEDAIQNFSELQTEVEFWKRALKAIHWQTLQQSAGHLTREQIVQSAEGNRLQDFSVENHLQTCTQCREVIEIIRSTYSPIETKQTGSDEKSLSFQSSFHMRMRYVYATAAIFLVAFLSILLMEREKPETQEQKPVYAQLVLSYNHSIRSATKIDTTVLTLNPSISGINLTVYVPHSTISSLRYSLTLRSPSNILTPIAEQAEANRVDDKIDYVQTNVMKDLLRNEDGVYHLIVKEMIPPSYDGIFPETYEYLFLIEFQ